MYWKALFSLKLPNNLLCDQKSLKGFPRPGKGLSYQDLPQKSFILVRSNLFWPGRPFIALGMLKMPSITKKTRFWA